MSCKHQIKLTPEEEKLLNESILKVLIEGLDVVRARFPSIEDSLAPEKEATDGSDNSNNLE